MGKKVEMKHLRVALMLLGRRIGGWANGPAHTERKRRGKEEKKPRRGQAGVVRLLGTGPAEKGKKKEGKKGSEEGPNAGPCNRPNLGGGERE